MRGREGGRGGWSYLAFARTFGAGDVIPQAPKKEVREGGRERGTEGERERKMWATKMVERKGGREGGREGGRGRTYRRGRVSVSIRAWQNSTMASAARRMKAVLGGREGGRGGRGESVTWCALFSRIKE